MCSCYMYAVVIVRVTIYNVYAISKPIHAWVACTIKMSMHTCTMSCIIIILCSIHFVGLCNFEIAKLRNIMSGA